MDLHPIIDEIASHADEFLAGARNRDQGRAGIAKVLTLEYNHLVASDRKKVTDAVMAILEHEDYFGPEYVGNPFEDEAEDGRED